VIAEPICGCGVIDIAESGIGSKAIIMSREHPSRPLPPGRARRRISGSELTGGVTVRNRADCRGRMGDRRLLKVLLGENGYNACPPAMAARRSISCTGNAGWCMTIS